MESHGPKLSKAVPLSCNDRFLFVARNYAWIALPTGD